MKKIIIFLMILVLFGLSSSQESSIITRDGGSVLIENDNYLIDWELEVTGHTPYDDNKFILDGSRLVSKNIDREVDVCIVSPVAFRNGSRAWMWNDEEVEYKTEHEYFCNSSDYGWLNPEHTVAYCNLTLDKVYDDVLQDEIQVDPYIYQKNLSVGTEYLFIIDIGQNATIYWNTTYNKTEWIEHDITENIEHYTKQTVYGNHQYCGHKNFLADEEYQFRFEANVDTSLLPVKYSVCFGDIASSTLYFCLDPEITTSRTWTTDTDFTNGTVTTNISTNNNDIRLGNEISTTDLVAYWDFDSDATDSVDGHDMTVTGPTSGAGGIIGNTYYWDGDTDYMNTSYSINSADYQWGTGDFTISFWVNSTSIGDGDKYIIRNHGDGVYLDLGQLSDGRMQFIVKSTGSDYCVMRVSHSIADSKWHHLVFMRNGTACDSSTWHLFDNNTRVPLTRDNTLGTVDLDDLTDDWYFGSYEASLSEYELAGHLDEIAFFGRALSDTEITALYNDEVGRQYPFYYYNGIYQDLQNWTATGEFTNINISSTIAGSDTVEFRFSNDNSTWSSWVSVTNGVTNIPLNGTNLFYEFELNSSDGTTTPTITDYTIHEAAEPTTGDIDIYAANWSTHTVSQGDSLNATANVTSNEGTLSEVRFEVMYPNGTRVNYTGNNHQLTDDSLTVMFIDDFENGVMWSNFTEIGQAWTIDGCGAEISCIDTYCACIESDSAAPDYLNLTVAVDLSSYDSCTLYWTDYLSDALDGSAADYFRVDVYNSSDLFETAFLMDDGTGTTSWVARSYDITANVGNLDDFRVRFAGENENNEYIAVDEINITCSGTASSTPLYYVQLNSSLTQQEGNYNLTQVYAVDNGNVYNTTAPYDVFTIAAAEDTCTPPASGDYTVDCSDACVWDTSDTIPANIIMSGSGTVSLETDWTFTGTSQYIYVNSGCTFKIESGGEFK